MWDLRYYCMRILPIHPKISDNNVLELFNSYLYRYKSSTHVFFQVFYSDTNLEFENTCTLVYCRKTSRILNGTKF